MDQHLEKFQRLLRELFQFDCADLDFGIYRIMNYRRDVIERFIMKDLPEAIAEELDRGALADQSQAAKELKHVAEQISQLDKGALDADGNLADTYRGTPLGKKYLDLKAKAAGGRGREALEAGIFNHLYAFFSRYYQDGDFISKRRYSKRQKYAIPYNGEEVYLYWANSDQYYIKTAEHFHDYAFTSRGVTVHFKLQAADIEQNNVKGDKRFFLPRVKEIEWKEEAGEIVLPFEYRPLTEQEEIACGKKNQQDAIIARALEQISERLKKADSALAALTAERRKDSDGESVTFLQHHLRQYTRRNTSDFFIHKDLKGFLSRELDFYLKNEVLNLDEMESAGEDRAKGWFQMMRAIKTVGGRIIDFLDQIESFQKMLWEKRKFITETQYCITVGNIDESFYPDIAACEPQWAEWKDLFRIDEEQTDLFSTGKSKKDKRIAFLKGHPTLVLDTKHFDQDFVDRLLGSFDDLDEITDGLLIHSENFQALASLLSMYPKHFKCIYIDPPYNAQSSEILYKNTYKHSSWLSLMHDRLKLANHFMRDDCVHIVAIDEVEQELLGGLLTKVFPGYCKACIPAVHNPRGQQGKNISYVHEFAYFIYPSDDAKYIADTQRDEIDARNLRDSGTESDREDAKTCFYPIFVKDNRLVGVGEVPNGDSHPAGANVRRSDGTIEVWPIDESGNEKKWRYSVTSIRRIWDKIEAKGGRTAIQIIFNKDTGVMRSLWTGAKYDASEYGTKVLQSLLGEETTSMFSYPKSIRTMKETLAAAFNDTDAPSVLDYFAGSGTTGHAVIEMNREDGEQRRFVLVEMGQYFDSVLLPRIKKVTFTPEWKDGKPKRMAMQEEAERSPRIVKYLRLESYEDALNNIEFDDASGQQALKFDDYLLKYMLKWETRASETLLNVGKLAHPFSYKLHIHADGQTREKVADVPETFNYLLGLHVRTRRVYDDDGQRYLVYRGRIDHRQIAVIWRETEGWQKADLERDKKFVAAQKLTEGADEVFVNGDSFIPGARALEPVFKARMFAEVQA